MHAVRGPRLALVVVQRRHQLGDVGGHPAPGQGQVRLDPPALVRRRRTRAAGAGRDGFGQPGQRPAVPGQATPQHVGPGGGREGARAREREPHLVMPPGGPLEPWHQPGRRGLVDLAEEGQGHVPRLPVGPAQVETPGAERLDQRVELIEHRRRWRDGHEQPHEFPRSGSRSSGPLDPFPLGLVV